MPMKSQHNPYCDGSHCTAETGPVKRMALPGSAGVNLCAACYGRELHWRAERNVNLGHGMQYPLVAWDDAEQYPLVARDRAEDYG